MAKRHGLIEAQYIHNSGNLAVMLSVAKRHGLIEATPRPLLSPGRCALSVAKRHGLIEAQWAGPSCRVRILLSVAKRHGLIEALPGLAILVAIPCYPWQNATASLKLTTEFSGAVSVRCYPWQNATASLKHT